MSPNGRNFSVVPTILLSLVIGTMVGVLLLLLFGRHVGNPDTVSVVNSGVAGTTVIDRSAQNATAQNTATGNHTGSSSATSSDGGTSSASTGTDAASTSKPIEGEAAHGSAGAAATETAKPSSAPGLTLEQTVTDTSFKGTGAEIYVQACQSCHMPGGKGAQGAGIYPALANNPKLNAAQYPISMVLYGNGGMPGFGHYMSDEQISEVVNYLRTELNQNTDKVSPDDVKKMRQPGQHYMIFGEAAG